MHKALDTPEPDQAEKRNQVRLVEVMNDNNSARAMMRNGRFGEECRRVRCSTPGILSVVCLKVIY